MKMTIFMGSGSRVTLRNSQWNLKHKTAEIIERDHPGLQSILYQSLEKLGTDPVLEINRISVKPKR